MFTEFQYFLRVPAIETGQETERTCCFSSIMYPPKNSNFSFHEVLAMTQSFSKLTSCWTETIFHGDL